MSNKRRLSLFCVFAVLGMSIPASAALHDRGNGMVYDDVLNITWLKDANYAATELNDARVNEIIGAVGEINGQPIAENDFEKIDGHYTGRMSWRGAMAWVSQLAYGGYDDWRLPQTPVEEWGYNISSSEMGFMYYHNFQYPAGGNGFPITSVFFNNIIPDTYWSGTNFIDPTIAFDFSFFVGFQYFHGEDMKIQCAWPVRDGDVLIPPGGVFTAIQHMNKARYQHTATLLPNGKVLIAGGVSNTKIGEENGIEYYEVLAAAETYDPVSGAFTYTGSMNTPRAFHSATLLPNGKVLIAGGSDDWHPWNALATAEIYDPDTGYFSMTGDMTVARNDHSATLLPNGNVLIVGNGVADIYNSTTGQFSTTTHPMINPRGVGTHSFLLNTGKVLITGGSWIYNGTAEIYDPDTDSFTEASPMQAARQSDMGTLLNDGRVLIVGGICCEAPGAEIYNTSTGIFTVSDPTPYPRYDAEAMLLSSGQVLIAGGVNAGWVAVSQADIWDPVTGRISQIGNLTIPRAWYTATTLDDGSILYTGGTGSLYDPSTSSSSAELYQPPYSNIITVTVPAPADAFYNASFTVQAIANSGLPVSITTSGVCSGNGSGSAIITMTGSTGTCTVHYNQNGNNTYPPATEVTQSTNALLAMPVITWIGLKNSDDQGTQFDLRAEIYQRGALVAAGTTDCITGVTRNPALAKLVNIEVGSLSSLFISGDPFSIKFLTRIGTNPDGSKCSAPGGSHSNAVGLRLYYDSMDRSSNITKGLTQYFLHSSGTNFFLDAISPNGGTVKYRDSSGINFQNGNPWKEIGTWSMTVP